MTNEEKQAAIEWLKGRPITMPGAKKMYALAIQALEMYVPDMNVGDMISRQAAMEMLMAQNVIMDGSEYHNGFNAGVNRAQEVIRNLPTAQPNHNAEVSKMEIIHCKDCNHYWKSKKWCICGRYVKETGFCDMADRKGEADGTD